MQKPLAYSYIRMSTDIQLKGDSLRRQVELSIKYADEHGLELVDDYKLHDIGVSAFKGANVEHGALGKFLEAARNHEIPEGSFLLVESWDRISRQKLNASVSLFLDINASGINIVTLADGQVYKAGEADLGQLIYSIVVMSRAHEESVMKSKRIAAAWKAKRSKIGQRILTKTCPAWLKVNEDRTGFDTIPERVKVVEKIFDAAAAGQGSGMITRLLNGDGVVPFGKSNGWIESYVTKILKNRAVLGEFQPHMKVDGKRIPVDDVLQDYYPQILDEDLFFKVQAGRRSRAVVGAGRKGETLRNLFTHLAKCDYCGSSMRFLNKGEGPKGGTYLRCSASLRGMGCVSKSWRYKDFEKSIFSFVREFDLRAVIEDTSNRPEISIIREKIAVENERLQHLEEKREDTFELLGGADTAKHFIGKKLEQLSNDIISSESEIVLLETKLAATNDSKKIGVDPTLQLSAFKKFSEQSGLKERLLVSVKLKALIREIRVATDGVKPKFEKMEAALADMTDDIDYKNRLLASLRESHFEGPRSNPHFTVFFHNETSRVVIPEHKNPSKLIWKVEVDDVGALIEDGAGDLIADFEHPKDADE